MAYLPGQQYAMNAAGVWTPVGYGGGGSAPQPVNMISSSASQAPVTGVVSATAAASLTGTVSTTGSVIAPVINSGNCTFGVVGGTYTNLTLAFEACFDAAGLYWFPIDAARPDSSSVDLQPNFTSAGVRVWNVMVPGYQYIRVRVVAITATVNPTIIINQGPFLYDPSPTVAPIDGVKMTWNVGHNTAPHLVTTGPFYHVGNTAAAGGRIVRLTYIRQEYSIATAAGLGFRVNRASAATGGTAFVTTVVPHDTPDGFSPVGKAEYYTAVPTPVSQSTSMLWNRRFFAPAVTAATPAVFEWAAGRPSKAIILRPGEYLDWTWSAAPGTAVQVTGDIEWTEE
jgi:hypothetical protein